MVLKNPRIGHIHMLCDAGEGEKASLQLYMPGLPPQKPLQPTDLTMIMYCSHSNCVIVIIVMSVYRVAASVQSVGLTES